MSLEPLAARGERIGVDAAARVRDRMIANAVLPAGIDIASAPEGIALTGKRLRHRFVTDPDVRNLIR